MNTKLSIESIIENILDNGSLTINHEYVGIVKTGRFSVTIVADTYGKTVDNSDWKIALRKSYQKFHSHVRELLKESLAKCSQEQQTVFRRMYAFPTGYCQRSEQPHLEMSIDEIVDVIPEEKLFWASSQVKNTLTRTS